MVRMDRNTEKTVSLNTVCVLGRDWGYTVKYSPLPEGTSEGGGLYLTVYPELSPNTNSISFLKIIMLTVSSYSQWQFVGICARECTAKHIPRLKVRLKSSISVFHC